MSLFEHDLFKNVPCRLPQTPVAVSYTHLDVYKRQVSAAVDNGLLYIGDSLWQNNYSGDTFPYKQRKNKGEKEQYDKYKKQQDLRLSPVEQSFLDSVEPVSYTHLDVYKRQPEHRFSDFARKRLHF